MANLQLYISHFSESGIWMGKILANDVPFAKFAKVFPRQNFALYGITLYTMSIRVLSVILEYLNIRDLLCHKGVVP